MDHSAMVADFSPALAAPRDSVRFGVATRAAAFLFGAGALAIAGTVGADADWLAALGHTILHSGAIPERIPFADAPQQTWHNAPVLAELMFYGLTHAGDRGLIAAQAVAVGLTYFLLTTNRSRLWLRRYMSIVG
jgi:hypothetical protein